MEWIRAEEASPLRKVAVVINPEKERAVSAGAELVRWLEARSIEVLLQPAGAFRIRRPDLAVPEGPRWGEADLLIALGGDGTLMRVAQLAAPLQVPILGVNVGHLGFLTELEGRDLFTYIEDFVDGRYVIEERLMLQVRVERQDSPPLELTALNDAVVSKGQRARLVRLGVAVGETEVAQYPADGVIIASPTGSTAYSLSAGGPIIGPTVEVLLITPICPHTMTARSIVVAASEQVRVTVLETPGEVGVSVDGAEPITLQRGDVVRVSRAPCRARLVRRHNYSFYDVLREKLAHPGR